jgi:trimeric autotransporter adhesin
LVAGAEATASITIARADNVIAVPTSAVHRQGSSTYVELLTDGKPARQAVVIGAVGPGWTEVRSGVTSGQQVVLANLEAAVPSSSNTLSGRTGFRTSGGFGGGGFAPPGGSTGGGGTFIFQGG